MVIIQILKTHEYQIVPEIKKAFVGTRDTNSGCTWGTKISTEGPTGV